MNVVDSNPLTPAAARISHWRISNPAWTARREPVNGAGESRQVLTLTVTLDVTEESGARRTTTGSSHEPLVLTIPPWTEPATIAEVTVPSVVGLDPIAAARELADKRLASIDVTPPGAIHEVVARQDPAGGQWAPLGSSVSLEYGALDLLGRPDFPPLVFCTPIWCEDPLHQRGPVRIEVVLGETEPPTVR